MDKIVKTKLRSRAVIQNPLLNKGSAFTQKERDELKLHGLIPQGLSSIEDQVKRRYDRFSKLATPLEKSLFLSELQNNNEILFYRFVTEHVKEMLPLVYTPTVGDVAQQYSEIHFRHRGLYLSIDLEDKLDDIFQSFTNDNVDVIVVTDGERILGLGDLGIGGIAIPIGKLSLYTLFGGIHPSRTLPIVLDVGTNNKDLLNNPHYMGIKRERTRGEKYDKFIASFVKAVKKRYPKILLQWEDFAKQNAARLLAAYRHELLSFNDDIQGTAAVALSAMITASKLQNIKLTDQKVVILGAGSAGLGIAEKIVFAMTEEGLSKEDAYERVCLVDRDGLLTVGGNYSEEQKPFAKKSIGEKKDLEAVIHAMKPTLLVGVSGQPGMFTEACVRAMAKHVERPAIFPLSNPNKCAEADPQDILTWTHGKAIIATGSPFKNTTFNGKHISISQCNNVYIFPGMGLGAMTFHLPKITDKMFLEASRTLSSQAPATLKESEELFPAFDHLRDSSLKIAEAVVKTAIDEGLIPKIDDKTIVSQLKDAMWFPTYNEIQPA
jgi:malate dehydrogenase (oxaloacetate-decarboxylating)